MFSLNQKQPSQFASEVCLPATTFTRLQPRRVLIATECAAQGIDVELIRQVFNEADRVPDGESAYAVEVITPGETCRDDSCRRDHFTIAQDSIHLSSVDTLFITGSCEPNLCKLQPQYLEWLKHQCARSRRIVAVSGGAIYLAAIGLLEGRDAVTHWSFHQHLKSRYPGIAVRSDILYAQDGNIYTCAGALSSVDLALRLVEDDLGSAVTAHVARLMLVPHRRTAICSQISSTLRAQNKLSRPISDLLAWLPDQLTSDLSVHKMARRVAMSPRNFARRFLEQVKLTPARYIEDLRFEAAKRELAVESQSIAEAAQRSGFNNLESLRRLFRRRLGVTPKIFREQNLSAAVRG